MYLRRLTVIAVLFLVATACGDDDTVPEDPGDDGGNGESVDGDWMLTSLTVDGVEVPRPDRDLGMTIESGEISGDLGCNSFFSSVDAADDGALAIGTVGQTQMACVEENEMAFESAYGPALGSVTSWTADSDGMTFSGDGVEIRYERT